jgi:O-antigen ligase
MGRLVKTEHGYISRLWSPPTEGTNGYSTTRHVSPFAPLFNLLWGLGVIAMYIQPVYNNVGAFLAPMLAMTAFVEPIRGLVFMGASVSLPDVPDLRLTNTQLAVLGWVLCRALLVANGVSKGLHIPKDANGLRLALLLAWVLFAGAVHRELEVQVQVLTGVAVAVITFDATRKVGDTRRVVLALAAGASAATLPFWLQLLGVPTFVVERYQFRVASVKQDPNALSMIVGATWVTLLGLAIGGPRLRLWHRWVVWTLALGTGVLVAGAASRGAFVSVLIVLILMLTLLMPRMGLKGVKMPLFIAILGLGAVALAALLVPSNVSFWWERVLAMREVGLDDRGILVQRTLSSIMTSPLVGPSWQAYINEYTTFPHNTYLDYGVASGVIGMILYVLTLAGVLVPLLGGRLRDSVHLAAPLVFLALDMASLSAVGDKLFWALWGAAAFQVKPKRANEHPKRVDQTPEGGAST